MTNPSCFIDGRFRLIATVWLMIGCLTLISCQSAPITRRPQLILMDKESELSMGQEIYHDMTTGAPTVKDKRLLAIVSRVGKRVAKATGRDDMNWEFSLVDDEAPNAYCLPGGKVVINSGILAFAENEAGLAAVIAHEAGHVIARHGAERGSHAMLVDLGLDLVDRGLGRRLTEKTKMRLAWGVDFVLSLAFPFSHTHELEADELGLIYMARAGYNPRESAIFWERLSEDMEARKKPLLDFLSSHPAGKRRLLKIRLLIPRAMKEYDKSDKLGKGEDIL